MFEVNNKNTLTSVRCFYCWLWIFFTSFPRVTIVNFEQVNAYVKCLVQSYQYKRMNETNFLQLTFTVINWHNKDVNLFIFVEQRLKNGFNWQLLLGDINYSWLKIKIQKWRQLTSFFYCILYIFTVLTSFLYLYCRLCTY